MKRFTKLLGSITLSTALVISSLAVTPDSSGRYDCSPGRRD